MFSLEEELTTMIVAILINPYISPWKRSDWLGALLAASASVRPSG